MLAHASVFKKVCSSDPVLLSLGTCGSSSLSSVSELNAILRRSAMKADMVGVSNVALV